jgi:uncharacterized damage-inducible protein DinB
MIENNVNDAAASQIPAWFARKFEFTFPVEQYLIFCVRLHGTPARLEEMLRGISREVLIRKPENNWSAQEHAGHLLDLESLWLARVDDFLTSQHTLTVADLSNRTTSEAHHNARTLSEILTDFRTARARLLDHVGSLPRSLFGNCILHPRLKQPMRLVDHLYFVAEHDDHHLARIWEMISVKPTPVENR